MELPELQQGLQDIQQNDAWLNKDSLMQNYGNWFGNDESLGEVLLGQLRAHNVDTQSATEAMLREILNGLVQDLNTLQQRLSGFTAAVNQQMQQTQAVADSIETTLAMQGADSTATEILPPQMDAMPTEEMPAPTAEEAVQPTEEMPAPTGEEPMPPAEEAVPPTEEMPAPTGEEPMPDGTMSDKRMKNIKYVVSDKGMKKIKHAVNERMSTLSPNIIASCRGGF